MKRPFSSLALLSVLAAMPLAAQNPPAPSPAPPAPAPPAPAPGNPPALLPPPATAAPVPLPPGFTSDKQLESYALGFHFASREKTGASMSGFPAPKGDDAVAGLKDVLSGAKSADYAFGAQVAVQIRRLEVEVDEEVFAAALRDTLNDQPARLSAQQQQQVLQKIQTAYQDRMQQKKKADAVKALQASTEFLAGNSKAENVKQTASGLQYIVEKEGEGKSATDGDMVTLKYKASVLNGIVFEESPAAAPARKPARSFPKGVQEGLALMKTGGKAKFWVPPALGYGENGRVPQVKGNVVLVYEIELLGVEPLPKPVAGNTPQGRPPVTAVTPPITVEIPPKPGDKPVPQPKPVVPAPGGVPPKDMPKPVPPAPAPVPPAAPNTPGGPATPPVPAPAPPK